MKFFITRDGTALALRKVTIELWTEDGLVIDKRRMFSFPLVNFARRLERKKQRMLKCAAIMLAAST
jgi:hypothetical protein